MATTNYKLSRIGSLLGGKMIFSHILIYILVAVLYGVYAYANQLAGYSVFYVLLTVVFVIHTATRISQKPMEFTVDGEKIIYTEYLEKHTSKHSVRKQRIPLFNKKAVVVRVRDIQKIKYSSNLMERMFNIGHIRIDGKVFLRNLDDTACNNVLYPEVLEISGIINFSQVCHELETAFPHATHTGIKY